MKSLMSSSTIISLLYLSITILTTDCRNPFAFKYEGKKIVTTQKPKVATIELMAISTDDNNKLALIRTKKETYTVTENEKIDQWQVVSIGKNSIVLKHTGTNTEKELCIE